MPRSLPLNWPVMWPVMLPVTRLSMRQLYQLKLQRRMHHPMQPLKRLPFRRRHRLTLARLFNLAQQMRRLPRSQRLRLKRPKKNSKTFGVRAVTRGLSGRTTATSKIAATTVAAIVAHRLVVHRLEHLRRLRPETVRRLKQGPPAQKLARDQTISQITNQIVAKTEARAAIAIAAVRLVMAPATAKVRRARRVIPRNLTSAATVRHRASRAVAIKASPVVDMVVVSEVTVRARVAVQIAAQIGASATISAVSPR